jgi:Ca-activated chloride channel family protein
MPHTSYRVVLLAVLLGLQGGLGPARAQTDTAKSRQIMIVFDGSGSMWGKIEGEAKLAKFQVAREALRKLIPALDTETRIGLTSFGHRRQADCSDVQVLATPEKLDAERILGPLDKLNPKGKGPITAAVREAARGFPDAVAPRSLIVIHDDLDNCQQDPCAAGAELAAQMPGLAIHVLSIGLRKEEAQRVACLATATRGHAIDVQTAQALPGALEDLLQRAEAQAPVPASAARPDMPAPAPSAAPAVRAPSRAALAPAPLTGPPALHLFARLGGNAEPLDRPVQWRVTRDGSAADARPIWTSSAARAVVPAAPGRYVVEVRDGLARASRTVELADAPVRVDVVLDGGALALRALTARSASPLDSATFVVRDAAGATVIVLDARDNVVTLPPGSYQVEARLGALKATAAATVAAGAETTTDIIVPAATLELTLPRRDSGDNDTVVTLYEDDPEAPSGRRIVARSSATQPTFHVPGGTYYIVARNGTAELRDRVAVSAGETVQRTLALAPARLTLTSRLTGQTRPLELPVVYRITRLDGSNTDIAMYGSVATVQVMPGRYRIESRAGGHPSRETREIDVRADETQAITFDHRAALVRLRLDDQAPVPLGADPLWQIREESGRLAQASSDLQPIALLPEGRYLIRADARDVRLEQLFEVRAGEVGDIVLRQR